MSVLYLIPKVLLSLIFLAAFNRFRVPFKNTSLIKINSNLFLPIAFVLTTLLVWLELKGLREFKAGNPFYTFGIFPRSDAGNYLSGVSYYLRHNILPEWNARRPLHTLFLAGLVKLIGEDIIVIQEVMSLFLCFSIALMSQFIFNWLGFLPALYALFLLISYCLYYTAFGFLSESVGLILGINGFCLLMLGVAEKKKLHYFFGVFITSLSLCVRAGAFFVLPFLVFPLPVLIDKRRNSLLRTCLSSIVAILCAFALNVIVKNIVCDSNQQLFSNFSFTLYGLAKGGQSWEQVFQDYPFLLKLGEGERAGIIYRLSFEAIFSHPGLFLTGLYRSAEDAVLFGGLGRFIVQNEMILVIAPFLIGLYLCMKRLKHSKEAALFWMAAGFLLSVPLLADDVSRVIASQIPLLVTLVCYGFVGIFSRDASLQERPSSRSSRLAYYVAAVSVIGILFYSFTNKINSGKIHSEIKSQNIASDCENLGLSKALKNYSKVEVYPDNELERSSSPLLKVSDFRRIFKVKYGRNFDIELERFEMYMVPENFAFIIAAGKRQDDENLCLKKMFKADDMQFYSTSFHR